MENGTAGPKEGAGMCRYEEGKDFNLVERVILERRSVRRYREEQVPEGAVRRILECGRFAPSAGNTQPWRFVVVRDRKMLEGMERAVRRRCRIFSFLLDWRRSPLGKVARLNANILIRLKRNELAPAPFASITLIAEGRLKLFHGAPTVIFILQDRRGAGKPLVDVGICGQNMVLAAHSLGLGTCWVGFVEMLRYSPYWKRRLGVRYPYRLSEAIAVGFPMGEPDGMVARELQEVTWFEDGGGRKVSGEGKPEALPNLSLRERFSLPRYDDPALARTGRVAVDEARCNGCGRCVSVCPGKALMLEERRGKKVARMVDAEVPECVACGDCAAICKREAIEVVQGCDFGLYYRALHRGALCPPRRF